MTLTPSTRHFARHYGEMVLAMLLGMAVLWMPAKLALGAVGMSAQELHDSAAAMLLVMATTMTIPMVAWMRYRGHGWPASLEMAASMYLPTFAALAPAFRRPRRGPRRADDARARRDAAEHARGDAAAPRRVQRPPPRGGGMKAAAIAGVAGALALIFGAAALMGSAFGPDRSARAADRAAPHADEEMEMDKGHAAEAAADPVRGLAVAERGLALQLAATELERGRASTLRFRIADSGGRPVRDFSVEHTKRMHVIVVRRDGQGFQHLHPTMDADGTWSVPLTLEQAGAYRVFADFKHDGRAQTLAADLAVDGAARLRAAPRARDHGDHERRLRGQPRRAVRSRRPRGRAALHRPPRRHGGPHRALPRRRRAPGRAARGRSGVPARASRRRAGAGCGPAEGPGPEGDSVPFMTEFPSAGRYRLYLQFKHAGRVHTAEFTQDVAR